MSSSNPNRITSSDGNSNSNGKSKIVISNSEDDGRSLSVHKSVLERCSIGCRR